jgi:hypothetical protein
MYDMCDFNPSQEIYPLSMHIQITMDNTKKKNVVLALISLGQERLYSEITIERQNSTISLQTAMEKKKG